MAMTIKKNVVQTQTETSGMNNVRAFSPRIQDVDIDDGVLFGLLLSHVRGNDTMVQLVGVGLYRSNGNAMIAVVKPTRIGRKCINNSTMLQPWRVMNLLL